MKELCAMMKEAGKTTYLEVVTYSEEECLRGAKLAVECGFDCLLGTIYYDSVMDYVKTTDLKYFPFVGKVSQSPSILEGSCDYMLEQAEKFKKAGAVGVDLLGYRYVEGDANVLSAAFVKASCIPTVLAGSIGSKGTDETGKTNESRILHHGFRFVYQEFRKRRNIQRKSGSSYRFFERAGMR